MKTILLFGAGKSATVLIDYLLQHAAAESWQLLLVDADLELARSKTAGAPHATPLSFDINESAERDRYIRQADIVISMLPAHLHIKVAKDCVRLQKNLLTASYLDAEIKKLQPEIEKNKLLFLYEMGLDPGIDHMSAMQLIDRIRAKGGSITSFKSHCGGLVAPESDDNPWHYKISWNPRNIVLAGKAGANYRENGEEKNIPYAELFRSVHRVQIPGLDTLGWYPNRDSLGYMPLYGLEQTATFIRSTLRHPDFMYGWNNIIELKLTDETPQYETDGKTLQELFKEHMDKHGFGDWLNKKLTERFSQTRELLDKLMQLAEAESEEEEIPASFLAADEKGNLQEVETDEVKNRAAGIMAQQMHEANLTLKQLFFLGLDDDRTLVNKGRCSAADLLQFALEKKLALKPEDMDMIVMLHEFDYSVDSSQPSPDIRRVSSSLVVKGENSLRTAMAKTVGLPLGIAARRILNGEISLTGLRIPTTKEIYEPVLAELATYGVQFTEQHS
ncbi:MAG: saccharopine dehydrogenase NADP-binding domain-containing protein [Sphingobacteriales bacterium]|nr:saccharopine dehydrogenase NADP-binding domain-containing protein [Sphingobacteriales bacterium]